MDILENYMVCNQPEYNTNWDEYYESICEQEDIRWKDEE